MSGINGKAELTLKINELPSNVVVQGSDSTFTVTSEGVTYRVTCKTKSLNKAKKAIETFQYPFVIAISGQKITLEDGKLIAVTNCGMQTFEKKPKEVEQATTEDEVVS